MEFQTKESSQVDIKNTESKYAKFKLKKMYNKYLIIDILAFACSPDAWVGQLLFSTCNDYRFLLIQQYSLLFDKYSWNPFYQGKSACTQDTKEIQYLNQLFDYKLNKATLVYRGSIHGWMSKDLKRKTKGHKRVFQLYKVKNGPCIGGFTSLEIEIPQEQYYDQFGQFERDDEAFLFNLTHRRHFPVNKGERAVKQYNYGIWGFGYNELGQCFQPFIQKNACISLSYYSGYLIGEDEHRCNLLTMSRHKNFSISELEVWALYNESENDKSDYNESENDNSDYNEIENDNINQNWKNQLKKWQGDYYNESDNDENDYNYNDDNEESGENDDQDFYDIDYINENDDYDESDK